MDTTSTHIDEFKKHLAHLESDSKYTINLLTILARDLQQDRNFVDGIVKLLIRYSEEVQGIMKLYTLYVIDSIIKNVGNPYLAIFETIITKLFVDVFSKVDCDVRAKLFKLRTTWLSVFSNTELHHIDLRTREIDPAWPLVTKAEDTSKDRIMSLPKIPKSKNKVENEASSSPLNSAPSNGEGPRDPRLKRKSSPDPLNDDNFMIDRGGVRSNDGLLARKIAKREQSLSNSMNENESQNNKSSLNNNHTKPWSNYVSKYSKLPTNEPKDVDMRVTKQQQKLSDVVSVQPKTSRVDPRTRTVPATNLPDVKSVIKVPKPIPGPPIRRPDWNVEIEGYPDMIQIGIDPRLLSLSYHPKPPKSMTIDRAKYPLFLDRIHPLIRINEYFHAVRFRCNSVKILIDDRRYELPGIGFRFLETDFGRVMACLGGPGHELIIDGRPHTVPMSGELTYITIKGKSVGVQVIENVPQQVNVLPAIPPKILKWAAEQLFGSPVNLSKPPRNPFEQMKRIERERENQMMVPKRLPQDQNPFPTSSSGPKSNDFHTGSHLSPPSITTTALQKPDLNVHDLFNKLMAAGFVNKAGEGKEKEESKPIKTEAPPPVRRPKVDQDLPSLKEYSWEKFKKPNEAEVDNLFFGYQCSLCGIRFESECSPEYANHLDYHFIRNATDVNSTGQNHHSWFQQVSFWLRGELSNEAGPNNEEGSDEGEDRPKCIASSDPTKNVCTVCRETFESYWDHDEEEWMIDNALHIDGQYFHPICREDAGKFFEEKETTLNETDVSLNVTTTDRSSSQVKVKQDPDSRTEDFKEPSPSENQENMVDAQIKQEDPQVTGKESFPSHTDIVSDPLAALKNILGVDKLANAK